MSARVLVDADSSMLDVSPDLATLRRELKGVLSLAPDSPHHFAIGSPRVALDDDITAYARKSVSRHRRERGRPGPRRADQSRLPLRPPVD